MSEILLRHICGSCLLTIQFLYPGVRSNLPKPGNWKEAMSLGRNVNDLKGGEWGRQQSKPEVRNTGGNTGYSIYKLKHCKSQMIS